MWNRWQTSGEWLIPGLALGLFSGRILSEQWAVQINLLVWGTAMVAVLLTAVTLILALLIAHGHRLTETWPLLLLFGYVFYPEPDPTVWIGVGLVTAVCFGQMIAVGWPAAKGQWPMVVALALVGLFFGGLYLTTLAPGLLPADNGEFQLVAAQLGVAHPPGFPLYTLLSHLMTRLPLGETAAWRVNLLSVLTSTAVLLLVYVTVMDLTRRHLAALTAVLALGTATTFWAQATTANIRSLTALFAALALWALVRFYQEVEQQKRLGDQRLRDWRVGDWWLTLFALALSLGFTHHLSIAFMGLVFVLFALLVDPTLARTPRRWVRPLLAAALGLLPLLYLPLRANADVRGASASLATFSGFLDHFLGLGFQGDFFYFTDPLVLWLRLGVMGNVLTFQFSLWLLAGMVVGLILMAWREWKLALLFGLSFALHTFVTATYRAPQTVEYMLPAYIPAVLCLGYGIGHMGRLSQWRGTTIIRPFTQLFVATLFVAALYQGWQAWPSYRQLQTTEDAREYAQGLLADAPPNATILANWHWVTPLWYLQEVEGQRPDVTVRYVAPGAEAYGETWAQTIQAELENGRDVIATWFDPTTYAALPPAEPLHEAFWFRQQPRTELPPTFTPLDQPLGENIQLLGYRLDKPQTEIWQEAILTLAWQPISSSPNLPISLNAHLIGGDGRSYAQSDQTVTPQPEGITLTQFRLTPRPGAQPGDYAIRLGSGESNESIGTLAVIPMSHPPVTQHAVYRTAVNSTPFRRLIGYDGDHTLPGQPRLYLHWQTADGYITEVLDGETAVPLLTGPWGIRSEQWAVKSDQSEQYVPLGNGIVWLGEPISNLQSPISSPHSYSLPQRFVSSWPILRDYVVSTRLVGYEDDGFHWAWCDLVDYVPALGAIPTLKWIRGSQVQSPHIIDYTQISPEFEAYCQSVKPSPGAPVLAVNGTAVPGQTVGATVVLYDAFTQRPLPILDERITNQFPWIPLGQTTIKP